MQLVGDDIKEVKDIKELLFGILDRFAGDSSKMLAALAIGLLCLTLWFSDVPPIYPSIGIPLIVAIGFLNSLADLIAKDRREERERDRQERIIEGRNLRRHERRRQIDPGHKIAKGGRKKDD